MVERWQHGGGDVVFTRYFNYPGPFECLIHWAKYQTAPVVDAFERNLTPWLVEGASISHAGQKAHDAGLLVAERFVGRGPIITTTSLDSLMAVSSPG
ncbi:hypothetical protein ACIBVK_13605 [Micromonospora echinofusca]|uniref:hypothetical protein n=1 Tax=Micromonospora echinofusca TaxID=47858 RepID=UPI00379D2B1D